jgi:Cytochrome c3
MFRHQHVVPHLRDTPCIIISMRIELFSCHSTATNHFTWRRIFFQMKQILANIAITIVMVIATAATMAGHQLLANDQRLLIETHRAAGVTCAQCHEEQPPRLPSASSTCLHCHGDQDALANKTGNANPNPHSSPHLAVNETQDCNDCHHVHRRSDVSCNACHRDFYFNVK